MGGSPSGLGSTVIGRGLLAGFEDLSWGGRMRTRWTLSSNRYGDVGVGLEPLVRLNLQEGSEPAIRQIAVLGSRYLTLAAGGEAEVPVQAGQRRTSASGEDLNESIAAQIEFDPAAAPDVRVRRGSQPDKNAVAAHSRPQQRRTSASGEDLNWFAIAYMRTTGTAAPDVRVRRGSQLFEPDGNRVRSEAAPDVRVRRGSQHRSILCCRRCNTAAAPDVRVRRGSQRQPDPDALHRRGQRRTFASGEDLNVIRAGRRICGVLSSAGCPRPARISTPAPRRIGRGSAGSAGRSRPARNRNWDISGGAHVVLGVFAGPTGSRFIGIQ